MVKKVTGYVISYRDNSGAMRTHGRYFKRTEAIAELRKILRKAKGNKTSYRDAGAWGGYGVNNPRIKKVTLLR